jgi:hypothetical protein
MQKTTKNKKSATTGILLGSMTFAILCASFVAVRPEQPTVAKVLHVHAHPISVAHAPKTANV